MKYYFVWVRSNRYHSKEFLTYSSEEEISPGTIIEVELRKIDVLGFIISKTSKPRFTTKLIKKIYQLPPLPKNIIDLANWLKSYYPAPLGIVGQQFLPAKINSDFSDLIKVDFINTDSYNKQPTLNKEQKEAVNLMNNPGTFLLHGRTGSGKTRVYIEMTQKTLKEGRSVIILSPEIGLSSQLYDNFVEVFGDRVNIFHSQQTPKERLAAWLNCLCSLQPLVIIGPRSALFSPLGNIGLLIIDEAHDQAYKQEQLPHYHAVRVASVITQFNKAKLILGSATPLVSDYYLAKNKNRPIIELKNLAIKNNFIDPDIKIVDLKDKSHFSRSSIISDSLIDFINESLSNKEQSLLFLNRRGTSRLILCENCGWEALCPNCNLPLIYHGDMHQLRCHTCGYLQKNIPSICQICDKDSIIYTTAGTKAVFEEVKKIFPNANIKRFDTDNQKADSIGQLYRYVLSGEVDILIGTQQLTKGFDLPKLSTVGILQADSNLYIPDYSSEERSFQLITQVLGRISRGHREGKAVIQTHYPNNEIIKAAINNDYSSFYEKEINNRYDFKLPPFYNILKLTCQRASSKSAESVCSLLKSNILKKYKVIVEGPAPSFHERYKEKYKWQLVVKSTKRKDLTDIIEVLPTGWTYDIDPASLL